MKVSPYLSFNGNYAEALALYEKAFGVTPRILRYSDTPPSEGYKPPPGTENHVMHSSLALGGDEIYSCDVLPDMKTSFGGGMAVMVTMDNIEQMKAAFAVLKEYGEVSMEPQQTFWSKCFCSLEDKFGVDWMLSAEE